jgi:hypothetical protein
LPARDVLGRRPERCTGSAIEQVRSIVSTKLSQLQFDFTRTAGNSEHSSFAALEFLESKHFMPGAPTAHFALMARPVVVLKVIHSRASAGVPRLTIRNVLGSFIKKSQTFWKMASSLSTWQSDVEPENSGALVEFVDHDGVARAR